MIMVIIWCGAERKGQSRWVSEDQTVCAGEYEKKKWQSKVNVIFVVHIVMKWTDLYKI